MVKIKTETIEGQDVDINVDVSGLFYAELNGDRITSTSLKGLTDRLRADLRSARAKIEVSWTVREYSSDEKLKVVDGFLVGTHATHGDFLLRKLDGKADRESSYHTLYHRLTEMEKHKFYELQRTAAAAEKAFENFKKSLQVDGNKLLADAQKKGGGAE